MSSRNDFFCSICGRIKPVLNPSRHRCPPRWRVWDSEAGNGYDYDPDLAIELYANDQREAAEIFCERMCADWDNAWDACVVAERIYTGERYKVNVEAYVAWGATGDELLLVQPQ